MYVIIYAFTLHAWIVRNQYQYIRYDVDRSESSFRFLRNFVDIENHIEIWFAEMRERFRNDGTFKLRERRRKIVEENGTYVMEM